MTLRKRSLPILLIIFTAILIFVAYATYVQISNKNSSENLETSSIDFMEKNNKTIFSIDKIMYFSSANANANTNQDTTFTIQQLYQFTDIAIFINNHATDNKYTLENTLKKLSITDIKFEAKPSIGCPALFYKNLNNFANFEINEKNRITDCIEFNVTGEDTLDTQKPTIYNNCANPIILSYVNSNVTENYVLDQNISNLTYDGSLLKRTNTTLNSIYCKISMTINITNNLNETFRCPIALDIPLSTENSTIYDGKIALKSSTKYHFLK